MKGSYNTSGLTTQEGHTRQGGLAGLRVLHDKGVLQDKGVL